MQGVVIKSTGSWYIVKTEDGELLNCRIRGKFRMQDIKSTNPIVVGDKVLLSQEEDSFLIDELFDRKNIIVRKSGDNIESWRYDSQWTKAICIGLVRLLSLLG